MEGQSRFSDRAASRETIPIRSAINQVLCPQDTHIQHHLVALNETAYPAFKQKCSVSCNYQKVMQIFPHTVLAIC
jgi:hypothetical protein